MTNLRWFISEIKEWGWKVAIHNWRLVRFMDKIGAKSYKITYKKET